MAAKVRFFLDENMPIVIAEQLRQRGIEVFTVRDLDLLGEDDAALLKRAAEMGCVFCTHDADYVDLAAAGTDHAGLVFGQQHRHTIGDWVKLLELIYLTCTPDELCNHLEYM